MSTTDVIRSSVASMGSPGTGPTATSRAEKIALVARVRYLEGKTFDDGGHIRRGVTRSVAERTVEQINELRRALGWLEIDVDRQWRWPDTPRPQS